MNATLPEFSRPVPLEKLVDKPYSDTLTATPEELEALARRFEAEKLGALTATVIASKQDRLIRVTGQIEADVTQTSVVSLKPVDSHISEEFEVFFNLNQDSKKFEEDIEILIESDIIEAIDGDSIDLGEIVAQHLSLALDPYPRETGEEVGEQSFGAPDNSAPSGPFAILEKLRKKSE